MNTPKSHNHPPVTQGEEDRYRELQKMALDFSRQGETAELEKMIVHGLPVNLADEKGNTLLMLASYHDHPETAKMLLSKGARVDQRNLRGQTPLSGAIFKGYFSMVQLLVEGGADIESVIGENRSATQLAAFFGRQEIIDYLRKKGAERKKIFGLNLDRMSRLSRGLQNLLKPIKNLVKK